MDEALHKGVASGKQLVAEPCDALWGKHHDITDKRVYEVWKKLAKDRTVCYTHYSPRCSSFSLVQRQFLERRMNAPYGLGERESVVHDNVMFLRTVALCQIHHAVGDFFTIEHIYPTFALEFECTKQLLALPGVFMLTFDNCKYDQPYRHRQIIITNCVWLASLSRDCPGLTATHTHAKLSDDGIATPLLSPFPWPLVRHWANLFAAFVKAPLS
jgi:hypothetical protein